MFYDQYEKLCQQAGKKPYTVAREIGLGASNVAQWKKGSTPRQDVLNKLANYFEVSTAVLLGFEQKEEPTLQTESERIPGYSKLSETNRAIVDSMIAQLLAAQSED